METTGRNRETRQVGDKTRTKLRVRSGEGTVAYWRAKLFRNSYRDRKGNTVELPEYYVRLRRDGVTRRVRLHSSDKDRAAEEALHLSERLRLEGWGAVTAGQARLPSSPTVEEFCEAYRKAAGSMESPPRPISIAGYLRHFRQVCNLGSIAKLRDLTPEAIERARDSYRSKARAEGRRETAIQNSIAIILRNAAACFSAEARAVMARQGLEVDNPFAGIRRVQRVEPVSALKREIVIRIWDELPLLRDGDPGAAEPVLAKGRGAKGSKRRSARWLPPNFRKPHPEAYCAILLALGAGLRANEIDKARWTWIRFDSDGFCYLEVQEEVDFKPKGGSMRVVRIPDEMYRELTKSRVDVSSPYITGGVVSDAASKGGWSYRRRDVLRVANAWLRARGVESGSSKSNPLHRLRKQFGSEVATSFGLFAAQKLLGHASPTVTAKYYAAQTDLPQLTHLRIQQ